MLFGYAGNEKNMGFNLKGKACLETSPNPYEVINGQN